MNTYQLKLKDNTVINLEFKSADRARLGAEIIAYRDKVKVEVHQTNRHPLNDCGVSYVNPICTVNPKSIFISHESLANLSGHGGGDVRTSSCDPEVYPWVLFEKGNHGKQIGAIHPNLGEIENLGSTRAEALGRLKQLTD